MNDRSPDAKDLWERAKQLGWDPSEDRIERVRQAVLLRVASSPTAPGPGGGSVSPSLAKWMKRVGVGVVVGGIAAIGAKLSSRAMPAPASPAPQAVATAAEGTSEPALAPVPSGGGSRPEEPSERGVTPPSRSKIDRGSAPLPAKPTSTPSETSADTLAEEVRLISEAKLALSRNAFAEALARVNDYSARYPKGVLLEEQLAIRTLALCGLGRQKDATQSLQTLERTFPSSRQLARVRSSCAGTKPFVP